MPLDERSQHLTSFVCKWGSYIYKKLPMGLVNAPLDFMKMVEVCLYPLINKCIVAYLDDVTTYMDGSNLDHLEAVRKTFECLEKGGPMLNPAKCKFFTKKTTFLGFVITAKGVEQNPELTSKVTNFPLPTSRKQLLSFVSLVSYYTRLIYQFAKVARPMHELIKTARKDTDKLASDKDAITSFYSLKKKLVEAPILIRPDFDKPFYVLTNASIDGLGAILSQMDSDGIEHPIIYSSRATSKGERNYGIRKLELCAIVWALKQFRPYLLGSTFVFTVVSDHACLDGLTQNEKPNWNTSKMAPRHF